MVQIKYQLSVDGSRAAEWSLPNRKGAVVDGAPVIDVTKAMADTACTTMDAVFPMFFY